MGFPIWFDYGHDETLGSERHVCPVWMDIKQGDVLNARLAKDSDDERHISPLQLDLIARCIRLWSNRGELVFDPFGGIGSTVYEAVKLGRRGLSIELKKTYWATSVRILRELDGQMHESMLF